MEGSFLIIVCTFTILETLQARQMVYWGKPSAPAATARDMAVTAFQSDSVSEQRYHKEGRTESRDRRLNIFPSSPSPFLQRRELFMALLHRDAIFPISVSYLWQSPTLPLP